MDFIRAVTGNINTGVQCQWFATSLAEHHELLAEAEAAGHVYMRPESSRQDVQTWHCRPPKVQCGQPGEYLLIFDRSNQCTSYVVTVALNTAPTDADMFEAVCGDCGRPFLKMGSERETCPGYHASASGSPTIEKTPKN
jgi:hypothetical protein